MMHDDVIVGPHRKTELKIQAHAIEVVNAIFLETMCLFNR